MICNSFSNRVCQSKSSLLISECFRFVCRFDFPNILILKEKDNFYFSSPLIMKCGSNRNEKHIPVKEYSLKICFLFFFGYFHFHITINTIYNENMYNNEYYIYTYTFLLLPRSLLAMLAPTTIFIYILDSK